MLEHFWALSERALLCYIVCIILDPGYGARDPRWVGAWWLGYILCPSFLVVSSLVMATFPKHLPPELEEESAKQSEVAMEAYAAEKSKELEAAGDGVAGDRNTTVYTVKTSTAATVEHTDSLELMEKEVCGRVMSWGL